MRTLAWFQGEDSTHVHFVHSPHEVKACHRVSKEEMKQEIRRGRALPNSWSVTFGTARCLQTELQTNQQEALRSADAAAVFVLMLLDDQNISRVELDGGGDQENS